MPHFNSRRKRARASSKRGCGDFSRVRLALSIVTIFAVLVSIAVIRHRKNVEKLVRQIENRFFFYRISLKALFSIESESSRFFRERNSRKKVSLLILRPRAVKSDPRTMCRDKVRSVNGENRKKFHTTRTSRRSRLSIARELEIAGGQWNRA